MKVQLEEDNKMLCNDYNPENPLSAGYTNISQRIPALLKFRHTCFKMDNRSITIFFTTGVKSCDFFFAAQSDIKT